MTSIIEEEDGFWKEVLDVFFEEFVGLLFPDVHAEIDWEAGQRSRDKELSKLQPDNTVGVRFVDKLVEVHLVGGEQTLLMVHVEVQSQPDPDFAQRMWMYYYRLFDRYGPNIRSLALLADDVAAWRPSAFRVERQGCLLHFEFPIVKLLDFRDREAELRASSSPFALLVLAILKAQQMAADSDEGILRRSRWKLQVFRSLYERGWSGLKVRHLIRFLDWVVRLPEEIEDQVHVELTKTEEAKHMAYITSFERYGMRKGMEKGALTNARENVLDVLEIRFGDVPIEVRNAVQKVNDLDVCKKLHQDAIRATSMNDFVSESLKNLGR